MDSHLLRTELKDFSYLLEASPKFLKCGWSRQGFLISGDNGIASFLYDTKKIYIYIHFFFTGLNKGRAITRIEMSSRYLTLRYSVKLLADFNKRHFKDSRSVRLPFDFAFLDMVDEPASL